MENLFKVNELKEWTSSCCLVKKETEETEFIGEHIGVVITPRFQQWKSKQKTEKYRMCEYKSQFPVECSHKKKKKKKSKDRKETIPPVLRISEHICSNCQFSTNDLNAWKHHCVNVCPLIRCDYCRLSFMQIENYLEHMQAFHPLGKSSNNESLSVSKLTESNLGMTQSPLNSGIGSENRSKLLTTASMKQKSLLIAECLKTQSVSKHDPNIRNASGVQVI